MRRLLEGGGVCKKAAFISNIRIEEREIMFQFKTIGVFLKPYDVKI